MAQDTFMAPGAFDAEAEQLRRRKMYADMLTQQGQQTPQGQMVSGHYVAPSWTQYLNQGLSKVLGAKADADISLGMQALGDKRKAESAATLGRALEMMRGTPEQTFAPATPNDDEGNVMPNAVRPAMAPNLAAAYAELLKNPQTASLGMKGMAELPELEAKKLERAENRQWRTDENIRAIQERAERQARDHELRLEMLRSQKASQAEIAEANRQHQKDMVQLTASMRTPPAPSLATITDPQNPGKSIIVDTRTMRKIGDAPGDKNAKLPASALKIQQEELEAIGTAGSITADTNALIDQIEKGTLKLGPGQNLISRSKNALGMSDSNSENFAAFKASIEKLRNDSLRLNKGVQTEGDAIRAMDELMANLTDPNVVKRQLRRINEINERAISLRRMNIDVVRNNFGVGSLDSSAYTNQPPATGATGNPASPAASPAAPKGAPKAGDIVDGYRFKGGNPADKNNWEKR